MLRYKIILLQKGDATPLRASPRGSRGKIVFMATHNQVRIVGYVSDGPKVLYDKYGFASRVILTMMTARRDIQGYGENRLVTLNVMCDGDNQEMLDYLSHIRRFDILDVKGVIEVLNSSTRTECPECEHENVVNRTVLMVYPQHVFKLGSYAQAQDLSRLAAPTLEAASYLESSPEFNLIRKYKEISNQALLIGTVITKPQLMKDENGNIECCRYMVGVDRKFVIDRSEDARKAADYPWVYTFGHQAEEDAHRIYASEEGKAGTRVFVEAAVSTEEVEKHITCEKCKSEYTIETNGTRLLAYSVEYLDNYLRKEDEDNARKEELMAAIAAGEV